VLTKHCPRNLVYKPPLAISPPLREGICLARATLGGGGLYASKYGKVLASETYASAS
jgi:hypothetical protein